MANSASDSICSYEQVVIRTGDSTIKGYLETQQQDTLEALLRNTASPLPAMIRIQRLADSAMQEIPIEETKAVFFVKEFDGDAKHRDLHFYRGSPVVHGVWIRVQFLDGEVMEGLVHNTIRFLVDPGFFVRPTDPNSNNRLVYVLKSWLKDFRILGQRDI